MAKFVKKKLKKKPTKKKSTKKKSIRKPRPVDDIAKMLRALAEGIAREIGPITPSWITELSTDEEAISTKVVGTGREILVSVYRVKAECSRRYELRIDNDGIVRVGAMDGHQTHHSLGQQVFELHDPDSIPAMVKIMKHMEHGLAIKDKEISRLRFENENLRQALTKSN